MQPKRAVSLPRKPYHKDFRFKKRNGIYYVIYRTRPDQVRITGQRTESDAIAWAYANKDEQPRPQITGGYLYEEPFCFR
jgi:hypothetical protein